MIFSPVDVSEPSGLSVAIDGSCRYGPWVFAWQWRIKGAIAFLRKGDGNVNSLLSLAQPRPIKWNAASTIDRLNPTQARLGCSLNPSGIEHTDSDTSEQSQLQQRVWLPARTSQTKQDQVNPMPRGRRELLPEVLAKRGLHIAKMAQQLFAEQIATLVLAVIRIASESHPQPVAPVCAFVADLLGRLPCYHAKRWPCHSPPQSEVSIKLP
jgi:hypothetical protein